MAKKTITLNLSSQEMEVVEQLCEKKGLSKTSLLKQSIRLYQMVESRIENGERLFFETDKKEKLELLFL
jgi:hypothetical protein